MKIRFETIIFVIFLTSCSAPTLEPGVIQTAIAETQKSLPTNTQIFLPTATQTLEPTFTATIQYSETPIPSMPTIIIEEIAIQSITPDILSIAFTAMASSFPRPTETNTPTDLPISTLTKTPSPLQETKQSRSKIQTQTAEEFSAGRTATKEIVNAYSTETAKKSNTSWRELINYPNDHKGELIKLPWAKIFNVKPDDQVLQVYVAGTYEAIYVVTRKPFKGIYEDTSITIYGYVDGEECFTNLYKAEVCQPKLVDAFFGINE